MSFILQFTYKLYPWITLIREIMAFGAGPNRPNEKYVEEQLDRQTNQFIRSAQESCTGMLNALSITVMCHRLPFSKQRQSLVKLLYN